MLARCGMPHNMQCHHALIFSLYSPYTCPLYGLYTSLHPAPYSRTAPCSIRCLRDPGMHALQTCLQHEQLAVTDCSTCVRLACCNLAISPKEFVTVVGLMETIQWSLVAIGLGKAVLKHKVCRLIQALPHLPIQHQQSCLLD